MENIQLLPAKTYRKWLFVFVGITLLFSAALFLTQKGFKEATPQVSLSRHYSLVAEKSDLAGIDAETAFTMKSDKALSADVIQSAVHFEPEITFQTVSTPPPYSPSMGRDETGNYYRITPTAPLDFGRVYRAVFEDPETKEEYGWAFQTKAPFMVISTHPGDKATSVPLLSGIEIMFNRENKISEDEYQRIMFSPSIEGRFEQHLNKLVFLPKSLDPKTVYTVTVLKNLSMQGSGETLTKEVTFSFETEAEKGPWKPEPYFSLGPQLMDYLPNQKPLIRANIYEMKEDDVEITVYRFPSFAAFKASYILDRSYPWYWTREKQKQERAYAPNPGYKLFTFKPKLVGDRYNRYVEIPETLASGHYFIEATYLEKRKSQVWLQVTPLAAYSAGSFQKSLLWVHDAVSQTPMSGAKATLTTEKGEFELGITQNNGLLEYISPTKDQPFEDLRSHVPMLRTRFLTIAKEGVPSYIFETYSAAEGDEYWDFLFTDRPVYQPTDTVSFWGILRGRTQELKGKKVTAVLSSGRYRYDYYDGGLDFMSSPSLSKRSTVMDSLRPYYRGAEDVYLKQELTISDFDTVSGKFSFEGLDPGYYQIAFISEEKTLAQSNIQVLMYDKPAYQITVTPARKAVFTGERVSFDIEAKFFDGTPVSSLVLKYSGWWLKPISGEVNLDENGKGQVTHTPEYDEDSYSYPRNFSVSVSPKNAEEADIGTSGSVLVFGPRIHMDVSQKSEENISHFTVKLRNIVLDESASVSEDAYWLSKFLAGPVAKHAVSAKVIQTTYKKIEDGNYYDYINKQVRKRYTYISEEKVLETVSGVTDSAGEWIFSRSFPKDRQDVSYRIEFTTEDKDHRSVQSTAYPWHYVPYYSRSNTSDFSLSLNLTSGDKGEFSLGDAVRLQAAIQSEKQKHGSSILYFRFANNIEKAMVSRDLSFEESFTQSMMPGVEYRAVVLGPYGFVESGTVSARFQIKDHELSLQVKPDASSYRPGSPVRLSVWVTDAQKRPVAAEVHFSLVDEAIFHILSSEYKQALLPKLYADAVRYPHIRYTSYEGMREYGEESDLGRGGGGMEYAESALLANKAGGATQVRQNFVDTALFQSVTTDNQGQASLTFTAPDNITSWRANLRAYEPNKIQAGEEQLMIPTTLPFFVDTTVAPLYLTGDKPMLRIRFFGTDYKAGAVTRVRVLGESLDIDIQQEMRESFAQVPIGELTSGEHEIVVSAEQGERKDAVKRVLRVLDSAFVLPQSSAQKLENGTMNLEYDERGMTELLFVPKGRSQYFRALQRHRYAYTSRLDQAAASALSHELLLKYFDREQSDASFSLDHYMQSDNGLAIFPYGGSDLELSAKVASALPNLGYKGRLTQYFEKALTDEKADLSRIALALYGLASLDQPVLVKLNMVRANSNTSRTFSDSLYLALAFSQLGDKETARRMYIADLRPLLKFQAGEAWLAHEADPTRRVKLTATLGMLAARLGLPDAEHIWKYVEKHNPEKDLDDLEETVMLSYLLAREDGTTPSFTLTTSQRKESQILEYGKTRALKLLAPEFETLTFSEITGDAEVITFFEKGQDPSSLKKSADLGLTRTFLQEGQETTRFKEGDMVQIRLDPRLAADIVSGTYQVVDFLPSGLKPITSGSGRYRARNDSDCDSVWYPSKTEGNTVYFSIPDNFHTASKTCKHRTINYFARVVGKGEYRVNPALIQSLQDLSWLNISAEQRIVIE